MRHTRLDCLKNRSKFPGVLNRSLMTCGDACTLEATRPSGRARGPAMSVISPVDASRTRLVLLWLLAYGIGLATAVAGPPFVTDDADTPEAKAFEINLAGQYTRY